MSRFTPPGQLVDAVDDSGSCLGVVVATSRHKRNMDLGDAVAVLAVEAVHCSFAGWTCREGYETAVETAAEHIRRHPPMRWYSVTATELAQDSHDDCALEDIHNPGDWCSGGQGTAWMDVLYARPEAIAEAIRGAAAPAHPGIEPQ